MENKDNEQAPALRRSARIPKVQQQAAARAAAQAETEAEAARQPKRRRKNASTKAASTTTPRAATKRATSGPPRRRGRQQLVNEPAAQRQLAPWPENQPQDPVYQSQIQPTAEAVRQPEYQQPALPQYQVPDQYEAQNQQETQYAAQAHYQPQVPQQQQALYYHQVGYPREVYQYGSGPQYQPIYPAISRPANPPATQAAISAPVHTGMYHYPQPQPEYHIEYETGQQQPLPTINQPAPPTCHSAYQTTQQERLPSVHQLVHLGDGVTHYDQTGVQLAPLQQASFQPIPAPAGHATHQNAQQPVQQPVAQPAHQPPPQSVAQAAEASADQPMGQTEHQSADEDNRRANVRIPKRKRYPIYQWSRSMGWPAEFMGARGNQNQGGALPQYRFDEIRDLAKRTVSGFTGPRWSNYNMPNGGDMLTPEKQSEVPTGCPIDRWTRDWMYDHRAVDYLNKWHCCLNDGSKKPDNDETTSPASDEKDFCLQLLENQCPTPKGTLFDSDDFQYICDRAVSMNEAEIIHLIGDLIVPQAQIAVHHGQVTWTNALKEKFCQPWTHSIPFDEQSTRLSQRFARNMESTGYQLPMPQPDHTVGFSQGAFSARQHRRLMAQTLYNDGYDEYDPVSFFNGPHNMLFPFLTTEVQRGTSFGPAERENAHNMAVAMKGIVTLFKRVLIPKEKEGLNQKVLELNRKVLGFSISHNSERVRIHAHYPITEGGNITYHRWLVKDFKWTSEAEKWQAYKFVMAVYNDWAPRHLKRLCSAIDGLPLEDQINMSPSPEATDNNGQTAVAPPDPEIPDVDVDALKDHMQAVKNAREREGIHYTPEVSEVAQA